jgi:glycosyltransferase involved in cell wall biosynthesis
LGSSREQDTGCAPELRVAVDARLISGEFGGVEQVIIGLAHGLSRLEPTGERYQFLTFEGETDWLSPYIAGACSMLAVPRSEDPITWKHRMVRRLPRLAAFRRMVLGARRADEPVAPVPFSPDIVERSGFDVIHFTKQDGFLTKIPSIYHPHDLQHVHLPEFFSPTERERRDVHYRAFCGQAAMVTVTSQWGKQDLIESFGLPPAKIAVIPLAPALSAYPAFGTDAAPDVSARLGLPEQFALYPAQTWPHKNHVRLIQALVQLRERGVIVPLVCTGRQNEHFPNIRAAVEAAGLGDSVQFLGFVRPEQLRGLYARARILVMPTLFEAAGGFGPVAEAFLSGLPVACSNVTSLPEQVGDAALLFDPCIVESIADAVGRLWTDASLRERMARQGRVRVSAFSWDRTAAVFRAHYRRLAGRLLDANDRCLIEQPTDF